MPAAKRGASTSGRDSGSGSAGPKRQRAATKSSAPQPPTKAAATAATASTEGPDEKGLHPLLARLVGKWSAVNTMYQDGEKAMAGDASAVGSLIMGGKLVRMTYEQEIPGMGHFEGEALFGYAKADDVFQGTWIDNASPAVFAFRGRLDDDGKTIHLDSYEPYSDARSGVKKVMLSTYRFVSANEVVYESFSKETSSSRAKPVKTMEIVYRRID